MYMYDAIRLFRRSMTPGTPADSGFISLPKLSNHLNEYVASLGGRNPNLNYVTSSSSVA